MEQLVPSHANTICIVLTLLEELVLTWEITMLSFRGWLESECEYLAQPGDSTQKRSLNRWMRKEFNDGKVQMSGSPMPTG